MADAMTFPVLRVNEIVSCSEELRVPITAKDLKEPQAAVVQNILESYLEMFLNLTVDDVKQPSFDAMMLEYPELHEESFNRLVQMAAMTRMMRACGITDFSGQDILSPEPKRLRKLLSGLINFAKFREMQMGTVDMLLVEREQMMQQHSEIMEVNVQLDQRLGEIEAARQKDAPIAAALEAECNELSAEINKRNEAQATMQTELRQARNILTDLTDEVAQQIFDINDLQTECRGLQGQIVQSPERIKREIVTMGSQVEAEKENVSTSERKARDLLVRTEALGGTKQTIAKALKTLEDIASEIQRLQTTAEANEGIQEVVQQKGDQLKELRAKEHKIKKQIELARERSSRIAQQQALKREAAAQSMELARREKDLLTNERKMAENQTKRFNDERQALMSLIEQKKAAHAREMEDIRVQQSSLVNQIIGYHDGVEAAMVEAQ